jgi:NADH-quinone oxidoreductase subunit J
VSASVLAAAAAPYLQGTDQPINVGQTVAFGIIAVLMVYAALRVVTTKNVVHAAMWLVLVLAGAAAQYILLAAEFVAVTQVMVYIGAVVVLLLFGVMLTRARLGEDGELTRSSWYGGAFVAVVLVAVLSFSLIDTFEDAKLPEDRRAGYPVATAVEPGDDGEPAEVDPDARVSNTAAISDSIFADHLIQLQAMGVLLTAALVGAIAIAKRD